MNFKKPKFWDYRKPNFIAYLLSPITLLITANNFLLKIYPKKKFNEIKTKLTNKLTNVIEDRVEKEGQKQINKLQTELTKQ